ncbi:MAG TPA: kelch repeat-containing protein [Rhizomicrobium sp.]|jgi:hypothetical protein|nr:kelch repeat-containing protein [Rhizomicrobium sp.]
MRLSRIVLLASTTAALLSTTALANQKFIDPLPTRHWNGQVTKAPYVAPPKIKSGTWSGLTHAFPGSGFPDTALLMLDGTVLMHDGCTVNWFRLTPDNAGSYKNGTWSTVGAMPSGYSPLYFASQVLPDGKLIVNGGEYLNCNAVWTNKGAIYDPATNTWTNVNPPSGWSQIGDAQSVVLSDGTYYLADCCTTHTAHAAISGTSVTWTEGIFGKGDVNDEEGWTQLPNQTIVTVDANRSLGVPNQVEIYSEASGQWTTSANKTPASCTDQGSHEIGPAPLLPNGLMFQLCGTTHTAVYNYVSDSWTAGPDLPNINGQLDSADGPAAVLPNGHILAQVSPGVFNPPSHFIEIEVQDPNTVNIKQVSEPASASIQASWEARMLVLPTGEVLWSSDVGDVQIYTPKGKPVKAAIPKLKKIPATLTRGSTNNVAKGFGFNGLTFGGYYGDDVQTSTNYPLIRITNNSTGHVCYAKTHDHNSMGISDGSANTTKFDVPNSCETGASTAQVVVNGIASKAKAVTVN